MKIIHSNRPVHLWIEIVSVLYLALPVFIFAFGWLALPAAIVVSLALILAVLAYVKNIKVPSDTFSFSKYRVVTVICALTVILWVMTTGSGNIGRQATDYNKHNAVMSDMVNNSWPVIYQTDAGQQPLVYYIGYYLPAAAVGKVFHSVQVGEFMLLPWTIIGILLVFYWLARLCKRPSYILLVVFVIFSGMDILGQLIVGNSDHSIPLINLLAELEGYAGAVGLHYPANATLINWAPQHAISGWLIGALLISIIVEKRKKLPFLLLPAIGLLWSPLVVISLIPIITAYAFLRRKEWREMLRATNIIPALILTIVLGLYFASGNTHQPGGTIFTFGSLDLFRKLLVLAVFVLVEFGILALLMRSHVFKKESKEWHTLFLFAVGFMLVLPFFRYGLLNDLIIRGAIASLLVLMILTARYLMTVNPKTLATIKDIYLYTGTIAVLALGSINSLVEFNIHLRGTHHNTHFWSSIVSPDLPESDKVFAQQYLGNNDSLFFRNLAQR